MADNWQIDQAANQAPAYNYVAGIKPRPDGPLNFWTTLPRGHDKTSTFARKILWLVSYSKKPIRAAFIAGDEEQAKLVIETARRELLYNPWLAAMVQVFNNKIVGQNGICNILASDAGTAYGLNHELYLCDELTNWENKELFNALWSGRHKRERCVFDVITNAGIKSSWQHEIYREVQKSKHWSVFESAPYKTLASWLTPAKINEISALLTPAEIKRVLHNVWVDPADEAGYLKPHDVANCEEMGIARNLTFNAPKKKWLDYWCGIDFAPKKDRTVIAVLHVETDQIIQIDRMDVLQGTQLKDKSWQEVSFAIVEELFYEIAEKYDPIFVIDPTEMTQFKQQMREEGYLIEEWAARAGKSNYVMAQNLRTAITGGKLCWYPSCGEITNERSEREDFGDELKQLVTKKMPYGYRFDHESNHHDDRAVAVGMPLVFAMQEVAQDEPGPASVGPVTESMLEAMRNRMIEEAHEIREKIDSAKQISRHEGGSREPPRWARGPFRNRTFGMR